MIRRTKYLDKLHAYRDNNLIKVLSGVRRCGKSTILLLYLQDLLDSGIPENRIFYMNLESFENLSIRDAADLADSIQNHLGERAKTDRYYVLLDEIQNVQNWERVVNGLHAQGNVDLVITGSNAFLLSSELATYLSGRYVVIEMYPLSFSEFLEFKQVPDRSAAALDRYLDEYITYGSFPPTVLASTPDLKKDFLRALFDSIIIKDIAARRQINNTAALMQVLLYTFDTIGNTFTVQNIVRSLRADGSRITHETVHDYLKALEEAYLVYHVQRLDVRGKAILKTGGKNYVVDTGICSIGLSPNSYNRGSMLENIVYLELRRRGYRVYIGKRDKLEIDFIATRGAVRKYYQVSMSILDEKTREREFRSLENIPDNFSKYILTLDRLNLSANGIVHQNLIDFLLSEENPG